MFSIHPRFKEQIADRLALGAYQIVYDVPDEGPYQVLTCVGEKGPTLLSF